MNTLLINPAKTDGKRQCKKTITFLIVGIFIFLLYSIANPAMVGKAAHEGYLYPTVRISTDKSGGSGTIIYSKGSSEKGKFSTYVLTNYHVVDDAITIFEEWDSILSKMVKKEKRSLVYAEIFKYKDLSTPVGTLRVEADVVIYNKNEDMAIVKLRFDEEAKYVANLPAPNTKYHVFDKAVVSGCSLGFAPLPTSGMITRLNVQIKSLHYNMSSADIVFGNSGGALYLAETAELIGIPSFVPVVPIGWGGSIVTHMGLFIPIDRVYKWLKSEHYDFIFDNSKSEHECLENREKDIEKKRKNGSSR